MNSIATQSRFNSIPYGSEPQAATIHGKSSRKMMAMKLGTAALCGVALATKLIAATQANDVGPMRMLSGNDTATGSDPMDPCAEFNTGEAQYVPFDRDHYMKTGMVMPVLFGAAGLGSLILTAVEYTKGPSNDPDEDSDCNIVYSACCAAVNLIIFGGTLYGYLKGLQTPDGECLIEKEPVTSSRLG